MNADLIDNLRGRHGYRAASVAGVGTAAVVGMLFWVVLPNSSLASLLPESLPLALCPGVVGMALANTYKSENDYNPRSLRQGWLLQLLVGALTILGIVFCAVASSTVSDPQGLVGTMIMIVPLTAWWGIQASSYHRVGPVTAQPAQAALAPQPVQSAMAPQQPVQVAATPQLAGGSQPSETPVVKDRFPGRGHIPIVKYADITPDPEIEAHMFMETFSEPIRKQREQAKLEKLLSQVDSSDEPGSSAEPESDKPAKVKVNLNQVLAKAAPADLYRQTMVLPLESLGDWSAVLGLKIPKKMIVDGQPTTEARCKIAHDLVRHYHGKEAADKAENDHDATISDDDNPVSGC